jgi:hypothetical protein
MNGLSHGDLCLAKELWSFYFPKDGPYSPCDADPRIKVVALFLTFLRSEIGQALLKAWGYSLLAFHCDSTIVYLPYIISFKHHNS